MQILWLSHLVPYPPKGGVLQRSHFLLTELSKRHEVDLLAFNQHSLLAPLFKGDVEKGLNEAKTVLSRFCRSVDFLSIPSEANRYGKHLNAFKSLITFSTYTTNWLKSAEMERAIHKKIKKNQYDLVHFDTISLDIFKNVVGDLPCVLDHHNIESHMMMRRASNERNIFKRMYFGQEGKRLEHYEKVHCPTYAGHITCSQVDLNRLNSLSPGITGSVIPNGVDTSFFKPREKISTTNTLIFVGTMNWYPNIAAVRFIAYHILPILRQSNQDIKIQIIGAGPPDDLIRFGRTNSDFEVLGFVDDVRPYMEKAALYLCPIRDGGGTKLKILDALSMEKAIIAHPVACEGIDVTDEVNVIFAESAQEFSAKIHSLLADENKRKRLGKAGRKLATEKYDRERIGSLISSFYTELVK